MGKPTSFQGTIHFTSRKHRTESHIVEYQEKRANLLTFLCSIRTEMPEEVQQHLQPVQGQ